MFDFVPFARAGRIVTHFDAQPRFIRQPLQLQFPQPTPDRVTPAAIGRNQEALARGVLLLAELRPPQANGRHREFRRVMTDPNRDDGFIAVNIVDAVRYDFAFLLIEKIVRIGFPWVALGLVLSPAIALVAQLFLLLRVDGEGGLPSTFPGFHPRINMLKLRVAIGVLDAFARFPIALQAVSQLPQQFAHGGGPHFKALVPQFRRKDARTLTGPAQGIGGVAARRRSEINSSRAVTNPGCSS